MSNPSMVRTVFWNALTRGMLTCPVSELGVRDDQQLPVEYDRYQHRLPGGHDGSVVRRHGFCRSVAGWRVQSVVATVVSWGQTSGTVHGLGRGYPARGLLVQRPQDDRGLSRSRQRTADCSPSRSRRPREGGRPAGNEQAFCRVHFALWWLPKLASQRRRKKLGARQVWSCAVVVIGTGYGCVLAEVLAPTIVTWGSGYGTTRGGGERWPQLRWPFPFRDTWRPPGKGKW